MPTPLRTLVLLALLGAALALGAACEFGSPQQVKLGSVDELKKLHAETGKTPEGALKCWFIALYQYTSPNASERKRGKEGLDYLTIPFKDAADWETRNSYSTFVDRCRNQPHIFRSYAKGTSPQNGYKMDPNAFELDHTRTAPAGTDRGTQVFVRSSGADSPRPIYMKQSEKTGLWYVSTFDNVYVDIRKVVDPSKETFK